jgi:hypothetical protein
MLKDYSVKGGPDCPARGQECDSPCRVTHGLGLLIVVRAFESQMLVLQFVYADLPWTQCRES